MLNHHLDANVIIGVFKFRDEQTQLACTSYCDSIGRHYEGSLSIVAAGEVVKHFGSMPEKLAREQAFSFLSDFIAKQNVKVLSVNESDLELAKELRMLNRQCDVPELLSLAIAIRNQAAVFMTLDDEMLNERFRSEVKSEHRITIQKPRVD